MAKQDKYGDIDSLLGGSDEAVATKQPARTRRPSPAIGVLTGNNAPLTTTDKLKQEKEAVEKELTKAQEQFDKERGELLEQAQKAKEQFKKDKDDLLNQIKEAEKSGHDFEGMTLTMPITKKEVWLEKKYISTDLIDVSPENERDQELLDEISLSDILPSFRIKGQQKPGLLRPKSKGRFELIEGSRRLASAKICKVDYLALVGDVPDADVRDLSIIENNHKDVSYYEKAKAYQRQIDNKEYDNWTQLGAAKGISKSHIGRYSACAKLDKLFVKILPSPSDMTLTYGEDIGKLLKKDTETIIEKAQELLEIRRSASNDKTKLQSADEILKQLKRSLLPKIKKPNAKNSVIYKSPDETRSLKHSTTNKGATKLEISGANEEQLNKILSFVSKTMKIKME